MRLLPIHWRTLLGSLRSVTSIQLSCWDVLNWSHKVYCVIVPHGGAFVNHIGFSRTEIYTEKALKPRANFPQKTRLWVAFALTLFAFSSILIYVWKLMETKHRGHREMCLHGKNKGLRSPIHGFCRFVLYLCLFAAVPHLLRPRQKAQHQKHRADCLFTHLLRLGRAALDFTFAVQFIL